MENTGRGASQKVAQARPLCPKISQPERMSLSGRGKLSSEDLVEGVVDEEEEWAIEGDVEEWGH